MKHESSHRPNTIAEGGKRIWVYPQEIGGRFAKIRVAIAIPLLLLFYALPWLSYNGYPVLRLSLTSSTFFFLGQPIFIYEFYHFVFLFVLAILTLFLMSAIAGRVWCGYGCPQTIFIEQILRRVERLIEGPAAKRKANDSKKWTGPVIFKKILKQFIFFLISLSFGLTAVSFFADPMSVFTFSSTTAVVAALLLTAMAWFDGAYWREQFCHIVCPYARLQSLMMSKRSVTIGYDANRGEPRKRGRARENAGDCIDCGLCVRVCPSGIDIRKGVNQLECIACARCIDGCDSVMTSISKPKGLIRYDNEINLTTKEKKISLWSSLREPRTVILTAVCFLLLSGGLYEFFDRKQFHAQVLTIPGTTFIIDGERVKNIYTLKVGNQSSTRKDFIVSLENHSSAKIESPAALGALSPGEEKNFPLLLSVPLDSPEFHVNIVVKTTDGEPVLNLKRMILMPGRNTP